jgi:hypothetical protein
MENIIVREYIESLNEANELDYIFPLLLESMGFRLITTPKDSRGQSQNGKDIVAIRQDEDERSYKYYFELKGFFAKDINDTTFLAKDGFRDSMLAAKYKACNDASIPRFNDLPIKILFVHNGALKENTRDTYDGFVKKEFPDGNFERWDIYQLTDLFTKYLFNEYLLTDSESVRLFKRTLVLLDAPDYDFSDFNTLVKRQFEKMGNNRILSKKREIINLFATLKLLAAIVFKYSKENNNLYPAKQCVNYIILTTWSWILKSRIETKHVLKKFDGLLIVHQKIYSEYIDRTLIFALYHQGLYSCNASSFELIGYPLRSFDYLNDLIYFCSLSNSYCPKKVYEEYIVKQKELIKQFINRNNGCSSPLLDNHSIPILLVVKFILTKNPSESDFKFINEYVFKLVYNIIMTYKKRGRLPELHSNSLELAKSYYKKSDDYCDQSSLLLVLMFELIAYFNANGLYLELKKIVEKSKVNLQIAYPINTFDIEQMLFEKKLHNEFSVETSIKLPETLDEFKDSYVKKYDKIDYKTDKMGYGFLRILAHIYYKTDLFPDFCNVGFLTPLTEKVNLESMK